MGMPPGLKSKLRMVSSSYEDKDRKKVSEKTVVENGSSFYKDKDRITVSTKCGAELSAHRHL